MPTSTGASRLARMEHPGLVPASLLPPEDPTQPTRRSARDWYVDIVYFVIAALFVLLVMSGLHLSDPKNVVDVAIGAVACPLLWLRRRWLIPIAIIVMLFTVYSTAAAAAGALMLFSVAVHRRTVVALGVAAGYAAVGMVYLVVRPQTGPSWVLALLTIVIIAGITAWGMFVRARRQLVWSLRERADRAEREQAEMADRARAAERTRIAREMHDVLAHRISLIALHAGGLEVRPDIAPDEVRRSAELLRLTARQALNELRSVIGVLRDVTDDAPQAPQPTLADIGRLVDEMRLTGAKIEYRRSITAPESVPDGLGRDAYRIVQEALTNVAKHARGTATTVSLRGEPGAELIIEVRNRLPVAATVSSIPGSGMGLVGLRERVTLAGGTLAHGPDASGEFIVEAHLRWDA